MACGSVALPLVENARPSSGATPRTLNKLAVTARTASAPSVRDAYVADAFSTSAAAIDAPMTLPPSREEIGRHVAAHWPDRPILSIDLDPGQLLWVAIERRRILKDDVAYGQRGRRGADAGAEREHRDDGHDRVADEIAPGGVKVLPQLVEPEPPARSRSVRSRP